MIEKLNMFEWCVIQTGVWCLCVCFHFLIGRSFDKNKIAEKKFQEKLCITIIFLKCACTPYANVCIAI